MTTTASQENITNVDTEHSVSEEVSFENVGRNDLCPCGSGKKLKIVTDVHILPKRPINLLTVSVSKFFYINGRK